ncbi:hypothetical protein [Microbacterium sp. WCS2018Hpa-23]|nr:hypothetical protein [Microbacterium sp. WCS2018Hpa-23]
MSSAVQLIRSADLVAAPYAYAVRGYDHQLVEIEAIAAVAEETR